MALVVKDRVRETSTTTGTGSLTLAGAVDGFQDFGVIGNGNTTYYTIVDATTGDWEVGIGTYSLTGTSLSRDTVLESSNSGSLVDFAVGTKDVFVTYPAERSIYVDNGVITPAVSATLPNTSVTGLGTMSTQNATSVNIDGGAIDGVTLGTNSPVTNAQIDNININGNTVSSTDTNGNIILDPNGTGYVQEDVGGTDYNLVSQYDIGTAPNEIPLNQYLGNLAYQDADSIAGDVVAGGGVTANDASVISVNSSSTALRITQTGSGNALVVEDSTNPDSTPFVVDAAGNVGIKIVTSVTGAALSISGDSASGLLDIFRSSNDDGGYAVRLFKNRNTNVYANTTVQNGDTLGALQFFGADGTTYQQAAHISAQVDGTPGTNDMPGRLVFSTTADGASSPTERMRIDNQGRVGIGGASSAFVKLNIRGTLPSASTASRAIEVAATIPSASTAQGFGFYTTLSTQADTFTLPTLDHFRAGQGSIGSGSTVTNQSGFSAENTLTGATNNYGFFSNIASGTGRWNFYAAGSANNYFAGNVLVGVTAPLNVSVGSAVGVTLEPAGTLVASRNDNPSMFLRRQNSDGPIVQFRRDTTTVGSISVTTTATAYNTSSDIRLKENIVNAPSASSLIDSIQVRSFDWKSGGHQRFGMVAQELETVAPEAVTKGETDDDMWSVDYSKLVPMLVKEIQDLRSRVQQLEGI